MEEKEIPKKRLADENEIPVIGLGTWQLVGKECGEAVRAALDKGYRHIDTAEMYGNEKEIGEAIRSADRSKLFLTSKVWPEHMGEEPVKRACAETLKNLGVNYLDLYLLHWPKEGGDLAGTFKGFKKLLDQGRVKSVGVSNFTEAHLEEALPLAEEAGITLVANQVEYHPLLNQEALRAYCAKRQIALIGYSPLGRGEALTHPIITAIASELQCTPAQVALRWLLQKGIVAIPKAANEEHARENLAALDLVLSEGQIAAIDAIDEEKRLVNPDFAEFDKGKA